VPGANAGLGDRPLSLGADLRRKILAKFRRNKPRNGKGEKGSEQQG